MGMNGTLPGGWEWIIPWYDKALDSDDPELYKANLPYKRIYPIPSSEINANKLMEQNPGNN